MAPFASCVLIALITLGVANGQYLRNITVDDTDPAITYRGSTTWNNGTGETDSYGGGHRSSSETGATATFTFTGVAVYYMMPLFEGYAGGVSTLLTLDSKPAQLVNLTRVGSVSTKSAVRWSASGLANEKHTLVTSPGRTTSGQVAAWGEADGFIYTVNEPRPRSITISSGDPRITYNPSNAWTTNSTDVPSCAISKSGVRITSTPNATFSFDFTGETVVIHTINSPRGGKLELSINGGSPQIYDTYANSTTCGSSPSRSVLVVKVKRSDILRRSSGYPDNITGRNVGNGTTAVDGITDGESRRNAAQKNVFMNTKFCAGTTFFVSYLLFAGIL